jgi:hypothetical protein
MIPETSSVSQLSQVISQAAAPGFILAALAAFTALLIARQNRIVDRTIVLNGISDDDPVKCRLKADLPRLLRRAAMMNLFSWSWRLQAPSCTFNMRLALPFSLLWRWWLSPFPLLSSPER